MRHIYILLCVCAALFVSCDKMTDNGDLDGMWQLQEEQHLSKSAEGTFSVDSVTDKKPQGIYWSFQLDLMSIRTPFNNYYHNGYSQLSLARFSYTGDMLDITEMYIHLDSRDFGTSQTVTRDSLITSSESEAFATVGIKGNKATFAIEKLDKKTMVLRSDYNRLIFRKF